MVLLMVHMPKCGGASFRKSLSSEFGPHIHKYYSEPLRKTWNKTDFYIIGQKFRRRRAKKIPQSGIVYGHYCLDEFGNLRNRKDVKIGTFFREPIDWVGSYLLYVRKKHPRLISGDDITDIKNLNLHKAFRLHLGHVQVKQLDFIGIVEEYQESLSRFCTTFNCNLQEEKKNVNTNRKLSYRELFQERKTLDKVTDLMKENSDIYNEAIKHFSLYR